MIGKVTALCVFLAGVSVPLMSFAAVSTENTQRLCEDKDLTGTYIEMEVHENPKGDEAKWFNDYHFQYIKFYENNLYGYVAALHKVASPDDLEKKIAQTSTDGLVTIERKYTLDSSGVLNLYIRDKVDYSYRCMVVIKAVGTNQVGDLMLTGYSKNRATLYKLFRRWP